MKYLALLFASVLMLAPSHAMDLGSPYRFEESKTDVVYHRVIDDPVDCLWSVQQAGAYELCFCPCARWSCDLDCFGMAEEPCVFADIIYNFVVPGTCDCGEPSQTDLCCVKSTWLVWANCCCRMPNPDACNNPCCGAWTGNGSVCFYNFYCDQPPGLDVATCSPGSHGQYISKTLTVEHATYCDANETERETLFQYYCCGTSGCGCENGVLQLKLRWKCYCPPE